MSPRRQPKHQSDAGGNLMLLILLIGLVYFISDGNMNPNQIIGKIPSFSSAPIFTQGADAAIISNPPVRSKPAGTNPQIVGDQSFHMSVNNALSNLYNNDPDNWSYAVQRIQVIRSHSQSYIDVVNRIYYVGPETAGSASGWLACTLPHEACHVDRQSGQNGPNTPAEEIACFPIQVVCLERLGMSYEANYVRNSDGNHAYGMTR